MIDGKDDNEVTILSPDKKIGKEKEGSFLKMISMNKININDANKICLDDNNLCRRFSLNKIVLRDKNDKDLAKKYSLNKVNINEDSKMNSRERGLFNPFLMSKEATQEKEKENEKCLSKIMSINKINVKVKKLLSRHTLPKINIQQPSGNSLSCYYKVTDFNVIHGDKKKSLMRFDTDSLSLADFNIRKLEEFYLKEKINIANRKKLDQIYNKQLNLWNKLKPKNIGDYSMLNYTSIRDNKEVMKNSKLLIQKIITFNIPLEMNKSQNCEAVEELNRKIEKLNEKLNNKRKMYESIKIKYDEIEVSSKDKEIEITDIKGNFNLLLRNYRTLQEHFIKLNDKYKSSKAMLHNSMNPNDQKLQTQLRQREMIIKTLKYELSEAYKTIEKKTIKNAFLSANTEFLESKESSDIDNIILDDNENGDSDDKSEEKRIISNFYKTSNPSSKMRSIPNRPLSALPISSENARKFKKEQLKQKSSDPHPVLIKKM